MRKYAFLIISVIFLSACSSTNLMTLSVIEPAPVSLHPEIKKIGVVDRTQYLEKKGSSINQIDQILSLEGKELDKKGTMACLDGLVGMLEQNEKISSVKRIEAENITTPGSGIFPTPLAWDIVKKICSQNSIDALFVLESFDTNTQIDAVPIPSNTDNPLAIVHAATMAETQITTTIKTGWRIYDPEALFIVDEIVLSDAITIREKGLIGMASKGINTRTEAVKNVSNQIGEAFGARLLPYQIRVSREYYVRGSDAFKTAKRKARTGNWKGASELWKNETNNPKNKVAGRAHYNMAIYAEIEGNLSEAIDWAQKAYENHNEKRALRYVKILKNRQEKNKILEHQY